MTVDQWPKEVCAFVCMPRDILFLLSKAFRMIEDGFNEWPE